MSFSGIHICITFLVPSFIFSGIKNLPPNIIFLVVSGQSDSNTESLCDPSFHRFDTELGCFAKIICLSLVVVGNFLCLVDLLVKHCCCITNLERMIVGVDFNSSRKIGCNCSVFETADLSSQDLPLLINQESRFCGEYKRLEIYVTE